MLLVRTFNQAEFGTYKQLFLIYGTLYGLAQFGMAESLYYFVPRKPHEAGPYIANALITLALAGVGMPGRAHRSPRIASRRGSAIRSWPSTSCCSACSSC